MGSVGGVAGAAETVGGLLARLSCANAVVPRSQGQQAGCQSLLSGVLGGGVAIAPPRWTEGADVYPPMGPTGRKMEGQGQLRRGLRYSQGLGPVKGAFGVEAGGKLGPYVAFGVYKAARIS